MFSSITAHTYFPFAIDFNETVPSSLFTIWNVSHAPPHDERFATIVSLPPFSAQTTCPFAMDVIYAFELLKSAFSTFSITIAEVLSLKSPRPDASVNNVFLLPANPASLYNVTL